jgi:hypothetical protein
VTVSVDDLFARITRQEQRAVAKQRRHEYRMAQIEGMDGEDRIGFFCIRSAIRAIGVFLVVLVLTLGGSCTAKSIHNTPLNNKQVTDCERAATAAHMSADCYNEKVSTGTIK